MNFLKKWEIKEGVEHVNSVCQRTALPHGREFVWEISPLSHGSGSGVIEEI